MAFGIGESAGAHEATAFWPCVTAAFLWFENGNIFWALSFAILTFCGGWTFIFMRRFRQARRKSDPADTTGIEKSLNIAFPGNTLGLSLFLITLVTIILSFIALWSYTSYLVLRGLVDKYYFFALVILPYLFVSVAIASFIGDWNSNAELDL